MTTDHRITLPAVLDNLQDAVAFVLSCARNCGLSDRKIHDVRLAVEEAVVNIMRHAYGEEKGDFEIACLSHRDGSLVIEISDRGIPFNVLTVPEPAIYVELAERKAGGLGVHLIKKLMDKVDYRFADGKNILTLTVLNKR